MEEFIGEKIEVAKAQRDKVGKAQSCCVPLCLCAFLAVSHTARCLKSIWTTPIARNEAGAPAKAGVS